MRKNLDQFMNRPNTKIIILTLTNRCNLSCVYCYEHHKEAAMMTPETALDIVEREMLKEDGSDFVCIYYFGGEPFTAFDTIRKVHAFLESRSWPKGWFGFATTNGTLVHGEIAEWLHSHQESMELYLSIDGTRQMHNRNRSNSYDRIDLDFFLREYPFAKMTVTEDTLPELAEGVIFLHEKGFQVSANLGYGIPWKEESPQILAEQMAKLIDYYLEHPQLKPVTMMDQEILRLEPGTDTPKRFCGVGPLMRSYDIDGNAWPCHAFSPLSIGRDKAEQTKKLDFSCPLSKLELDEKCRSCPVIGYCPTCYGINFYASGNVYHIPEDHCRMMKTLFLGNAMFQYRKYKLGQLSLSPGEELKLLQNIRACQALAD